MIQRCTPLMAGLAVLSGALCAGQAGATVFVPTDWPTIGQGLDYAHSIGDPHVWVDTGDYYEQELDVHDGITLEGAGAAFTRIVAASGTTGLLMQPGSAVSNLTVDGGANAVYWDGNAAGTFAITDCWFYDQESGPVWMPSGAGIELTLERNVFVRPGQATFFLLDGGSLAHVRNNHFVGTGSESYLELYIEEGGGGTFEVRNNIFESGERALDLWLDPEVSITVEVSNNVFNANEYGISLACTNQINFYPNIQNNWFVEGRYALYLSQCTIVTGNPGWHDYNGFDGNTDDIDQGTIGANSFNGTPLFVNAVADDSHLADDYQLVPGTLGTNLGNPNPFYEDLDTTTNDVGAYGGPFAESWNWDGDPVPEDQGDCDDRAQFIFPGAPEICDGLDNDCDQVVPSDETTDADADGYLECGDCDDSLACTFPGAPEICDGLDNDCDGLLPLDENDGDTDGWMSCNGDCDDTDGALNPVDADGDSFSSCTGDCDDGNPQMWPGNEEVCDGVDNDCDGSPMPEEVDVDGDGWAPCEGDCDDLNDKVAPDLDEVCDDGHDNDCDGEVDDEDGDCGGGDDDVGDDDVGDDDVSDDDAEDDDVSDDDTGVEPEDDLPSGLHCQCRSTGNGSSPASVAGLLLALLWVRRRF